MTMQPIKAVSPAPSPMLPQEALKDLRKSGLSDETIRRAHITLPNDQDVPQVAIEQGWKTYKIPYHTPQGQIIPNYHRLKLLPGTRDYKYHQTRGVTHAYLPPNWPIDDWPSNPTIPLLITEGEKKALKATQEGFLCIGLGGVDSWRCRQLEVKAEHITQTGRTFTVRLDEVQLHKAEERVVPEFLSIDWSDRQVGVIFDSDAARNDHVMRASLELCLWLEDQQAIVSMYILPTLTGLAKTGLDDFLTHKNGGSERLAVLLEADSFFPAPRQPRAWIQRELNTKGQSPRRTQQRIARAVTARLDMDGRRFKDEADQSYYFDESTKVLHSFRWSDAERTSLRTETFGTLLHQRFGISTADSSIVARIADSFMGTPPISFIRPKTIAYSPSDESADTTYLAISDSRMARVRSAGIDFLDNGSDDILFRSTDLPELDERQLKEHIREFSSVFSGPAGQQTAERPVPSMWEETVRSLHVRPLPGLTVEETAILLTAQFHLSPYLRHWRGLMLPLELCVAEPNSGKTFLYNLRKAIYSGYPSLNHSPTTMKDWYASIVNGDGMYIGDNASSRMVREVKDTWSDEMARLTTDPDPSIETRQLYSTMSLARYHISTTFAVTAVDNPFQRPDLLQRALMFKMREVPKGERRGDWYDEQLRAGGGGRERWIGNQLAITQQFLRLVQEEWDPHYKSFHRLKNYEQAIIVMGGVLGFPRPEMQELMQKYSRAMQEVITFADPVIEALYIAATELMRTKRTTMALQDLVSWFGGASQMGIVPSGIRTLQSEIGLGRYWNSHEADIEQSTGLQRYLLGNRTWIRLTGIPVPVADRDRPPEI